MMKKRDEGFTLLEMLLVVVVLGILAAVVVFSLGGVTASAEVASCNSDANVVNTAVTAYDIQTGGNPVVTPALLTTTGAPYLQSYPASTAYAITINGAGKVMIAAPVDATPVPYGTSGACSGAGSSSNAPIALAAADWNVALGSASVTSNAVGLSSGVETRVMSTRTLSSSYFTLNAQVNFLAGSGYGVIFDETGNAATNLTGYIFQVDPGGGGFLVRSYNGAHECGVALDPQPFPSSFNPNATHLMSMTVSGDTLSVSFDGTLLYNVASLSAAQTASGCPTPSSLGTGFGLRVWSANTQLTVSNATLTLGTPPVTTTTAACANCTTAADWSVMMGSATLSGGTVTLTNGETRVMSTKALSSANVTFNANVNFSAGNGFGLVFDETGNGANNLSGYILQVDPGGGGFLVRSYKNNTECSSALAYQAFPAGFNPHTPQVMTLVVNGNAVSLSFNGTLDYSVPSLSAALASSGCPGATSLGQGFGLRTWSAGTQLTLSNVTLSAA